MLEKIWGSNLVGHNGEYNGLPSVSVQEVRSPYAVRQGLESVWEKGKTPLVH